MTSSEDNGGRAFSLKNVLEGLHSAEGAMGTPETVYAVGFEDWVNNGEDGEPDAVRKEHLDRICRGWKMSGAFKEVLGGK
jgi:hypothetical protein